MIVKVGPRVYEMSVMKFYELSKIGREQVSFGVYAIIKKDGSYGELTKMECNSKTELKRLKKSLKSKGYKVLSNG